MALPYLEANPPKRRQFYETRREPISGCVAWHTVESIMDTVGIDTGAENVASFIRNRSDAGSYHEIHDSDSSITMVKDSSAAFHVAADGHNQHAFGVAAACRTVDWQPGHWWTELTLKRMVKGTVDFWVRNNFDPRVCARFLTRDRALQRVPGIYLHGTLQPADRHDAWAKSPHRKWLENRSIELIHEYIGLSRPNPIPPTEEKDEDMRPFPFQLADKKGEFWWIGGDDKIHRIGSPSHLRVLYVTGVIQPHPAAPASDNGIATIGDATEIRDIRNHYRI